MEKKIQEVNYMLEDEKIVQTETVSEGADSKAEVKAEAKTEVKQVSPEDVIAQKISEATKSYTEMVEASKRELQSLKDKHKLELSRAQGEANLHKETFSAFKSNLGEIDPEMSKNLELAEYKAKDRATAIESQREQTNKQQQETIDRFNSNMTQFITDSGLDPNDKRVDWGTEAQTLLEKQQKILASVAKIHKANAKDSEEKQSKTLKEEIAKVRKELGLDSVDTSNPTGTTGNQVWLEKWGNGEIEATPQNLKKAMELQIKRDGG